MKIRAIALTNVRRFAGQTARIELGPGITVLSEPNEFGKSTFFDALHALFFERHRGTRAAVKSLQPHVGGAPEVAVEFDLPSGSFRVEKRWLSRATARVLQDGRLIAQDDEAEAWIDTVVGGGLAGPSGLLWVRQGVLGMEPQGNSASDRQERDLALSARRNLLSSVAGEIDMVTGGRRLDAVVTRVADSLAKLATTTGRPKAGGEWARTETELETLRARETELAHKALRLSSNLQRCSGLQRQLRDIDDPEAVRRRRDALARAEEADGRARAHAEKLGDAQRALNLAAVAEENTRVNIERLEGWSERLTETRRESQSARESAERAEARAEVALALDRKAAEDHAAALDAARGLQERLRTAQRRSLAAVARGRMEELARNIERAEAYRSRLEEHVAKRALILVTPQALAEAELARDRHDLLSAQHAAKAVTLFLQYEGAGRVSEAGQDLPEGQHRIVTRRDFHLAGIGRMTLAPGLGTGDDPAALEKAAADLAAKLAACGAQTLIQARQLLGEAQYLDGEIRADGALIAELAPEGLEALRQAHARSVAEAGADISDAAEDPALLEAELAKAGALEATCRDRATEAHAAHLSAAEARAGARSTLAAADRAFESATATAGDVAVLATRLDALRTDQVAQLARLGEATALCAALEQAQPDMEAVAASLAHARSVVEQAAVTREKLREELAMLNGSIGSMAEEGIEEELDEVRGRLTSLGLRAARYAAEVQALTRLRMALEDARREARDAYFGPVLRELEPLISVLHPGAALQIDDQTLLPTTLTRNGQPEPLDILSGGTREQVAILTRLAFARLFARSGRSVPVILDDALVHSDDDRIEAMFTALHRVAADQQILVLTCRQRAFSALGGERALPAITPSHP